MFPERTYPDYHWPQRYWPNPSNLIEYLSTIIRTRRHREERWFVTLINSSGTRYELGWVDIVKGGTASIGIGAGVPNGTYSIEVKSYGVSWEGLIQKNFGTVTVDTGSSTPVVDDLPIFTNFRYDIFEGWLRLLWDGDVPPSYSLSAGVVSAGIWLTSGIPDFGASPTVTIPLFAYHTEHQYIIQLNEDLEDVFESLYWLEGFWLSHWRENHWLSHTAFNYAGLAAINDDGDVGPGQYINLPDRSVLEPAVIVTQE